MSKCDLRVLLDGDRRDFAAGDRITGAVEVVVNAACECKALTVTMHWRTHGRGNRTRGGEQTQVVHSGPLAAGEALLFEFGFDAPPGPFTYHGTLLNVDWYLEARADIPWALDPKAEVDFVLRPSPAAPAATVETARLGSPALTGTAAGCLAAFGSVFLLAGLGAGLLSLGSCLGWAKVSGDAWVGCIIGPVFTLVGGAIVAAGVSRMLARSKLGPVDLQVEPDPLAPGQRTRVRVVFTPRAFLRLERATAKLVGRERVVSGSGTNRRTHTHGLHEEVVELCGARELAAGEPVVLEGDLAVPPGAPPSFSARDNELGWLVATHLAIAGWPDWDQERQLTVLPVA